MIQIMHHVRHVEQLRDARVHILLRLILHTDRLPVHAFLRLVLEIEHQPLPRFVTATRAVVPPRFRVARPVFLGEDVVSRSGILQAALWVREGVPAERGGDEVEALGDERAWAERRVVCAPRKDSVESGGSRVWWDGSRGWSDWSLSAVR